MGFQVHVSGIPPRPVRLAIIFGLLFTLASLSSFSQTQSPLNFITETAKTTYECLTYDCSRNKVPEILNILQLKCEAEKVQLGCSKITDKDPSDAKYIRSCNFKNICERKLMPSLGLNVVACLRGAASVYTDYAELLQRISYSVEAHQDELRSCTSVSCKRSMSKGVPEFDRMDDTTLLKYSPAYIESKVGSYRAYIGHFEREQAAHKYFNENTGLKRFNENQVRSLHQTTTLDADYVALGKKVIKDAGIVLDCYDERAYAEILCHGVLKVVLPGIAFKGGITAIRSVASLTVGTIERRGYVASQEYFFESERSLIRQLFSEKHFFKKFTTKAQNQFYINAAEESVPKPGRLFFRVENGILKYLNTVIGDKVLITSINNKYNEILFRKIEEIKKRFPGIEFSPYQGFKEVEFMAITKDGRAIPDQLLKEVDRAFQDANKELKSHLDVNRILRASDQPETWYRAGVGRTGDMANAAARESRNDLSQNVLVNFDDPAVLAKLEKSVSEGRNLTEQLTREFAGSELVSVRDGVATLNADVMGLVRKYPDSAELHQALAAKYSKQSISLEQSDRIRQIYEIQDRFSPPVRFAEREIASFTSTRGTEVGIDFVNAGGANAEGQLRALISSRNGAEMMSRSRVEFSLATDELNRKKSQFVSIAEDLAKLHNRSVPNGQAPMTVSVAKSGDDSVATFSEVLTQEQKDWMAKEWVRRETALGRSPSSARMSIPSEAVSNVVQKNVLGGHGESIEKSLRSKLIGNLSNRDLDQLLVKVEMKGHVGGTGYVDLSLAMPKGKSLTSDQILAIKRYFEKAIKDVNSTSGSEKLGYGAGEMKIIGF